jgi:hypothetical protein
MHGQPNINNNGDGTPKRKLNISNFVLIARHSFTSMCAVHYVTQNTCFDVLRFLHETSLIQARIQGYINVNILWSSSKMPDIFVRF